MNPDISWPRVFLSRMKIIVCEQIYINKTETKAEIALGYI